MIAHQHEMTMQDHQTLLAALQHANCYQHPVDKTELIETHISSVILTGAYAYKLKKPLDLGFLDFSTLDKRHFCCDEELRLNKRLAPKLYLKVLPISGTPEQPVLDSDAAIIDYAIQMHEFPQTNQLDKLLDKGKLSEQHIRQLADCVARFHGLTDRAASNSDYGNPSQVTQPVADNFTHIRKSVTRPELISRLAQLESWCQQQGSRLHELFAQRKQEGFIRECHGDMHLRNMVLLNDEIMLFDCIEFNPELRWIDTMSDIAFVVMDLEDRQQAKLAQLFLNRYLEQSGDYAGLALLNYYKVYRALVRAKVAAIRLGQAGLAEHERQTTLDEFGTYLHLAEQETQPGKSSLTITRGLSGSGKSFYSQQIAPQIAAICLRSDTERLRRFPAGKEAQRYSKVATQETYQQLAKLAKQLITLGYPVIVDATFLDVAQITLFQQLANAQQCPFSILEFHADPDVLRQRIHQRKDDISEATIDVLEKQLQNWQALPAELAPFILSVDTEHAVDLQTIEDYLLR